MLLLSLRARLELVRRTAIKLLAQGARKAHPDTRAANGNRKQKNRVGQLQTNHVRAAQATLAERKRTQRRTRAAADAGVRSNCFPFSNFSLMRSLPHNLRFNPKKHDSMQVNRHVVAIVSDNGAITLIGVLFQETLLTCATG
ncbi:hypothetical protein X943_003150 [Babesia divergens]|uniref:Uncharacterized protein n=1 Tax=Babesia divergens TaxID=32595 RepID=A0AAD9LLA6_BABDI|nr:hypothetical protein X943_003150 [Babesia divergens]